jgi:hypothetical protein
MIALRCSLLVCLAACTSSPPSVPVQQYGLMREVHRDHQIQARVALAGFNAPGWQAVGALADLAGEVTIIDGVVMIEQCETVTPRCVMVPRIGHVYPPYDYRATLLTAARVTAFRDVPLPQAVDDAALTAAIQQALGAAATEPVAFRVQGTAAALTMHCVRGAVPGDDPKKAPWTHTATAPVAVTLVGFFAPGREGEMTHHGTALHVHAVLTVDGRMATGHVDDFRMQPGAVLQLPSNR